MCYRTKLNTRLEEIEKTFDAKFLEPENYKPKEEINGFANALHPIITDENSKDIIFYEWGLIPKWAKDKGFQKKTLNATIENLPNRNSYKNSINKRCLILADGFYEWQWLDPKGKEKQKYIIKPKDQNVFALAGIYSLWNNPNTDEQIGTFSIVTTEANELMSEIHNNKKRMPVVLNANDTDKWLFDSDYSAFAFPYETNLVAEKC